MYIKELPIETKLNIHIRFDVIENSNNINILSNTIYISESDKNSIKQILKQSDFVAIDLTKAKNLFIDFDSDKVNYSVIAVVKEQAYIFKDCKLRCIQVGDRQIHILQCEENGRKLVRRETYRIEIGKDMIVQNQLVKLRDLSIGGVSFISPKDADFSIGDIFSISFNDEKEISLQVQIVRIEEYRKEEDKNVIGCVILKGNNNIGTYINKKQREKLSQYGRLVF